MKKANVKSIQEKDPDKKGKKRRNKRNKENKRSKENKENTEEVNPGILLDLIAKSQILNREGDIDKND